MAAGSEGRAGRPARHTVEASHGALSSSSSSSSGSSSLSRQRGALSRRGRGVPTAQRECSLKEEDSASHARPVRRERVTFSDQVQDVVIEMVEF